MQEHHRLAESTPNENKAKDSTKLTTKPINMFERCRWLCALVYASNFNVYPKNPKNKESLWASICWIRCNTAQQWHTVVFVFCLLWLLFCRRRCCLVYCWCEPTFFRLPSFSCVLPSFSGCNREFNHHSVSASARVDSAFMVLALFMCVQTHCSLQWHSIWNSCNGFYANCTLKAQVIYLRFVCARPQIKINSHTRTQTHSLRAFGAIAIENDIS